MGPTDPHLLAAPTDLARLIGGWQALEVEYQALAQLLADPMTASREAGLDVVRARARADIGLAHLVRALGPGAP